MKERTSYQGLCLLHPTSITYHRDSASPWFYGWWGIITPSRGHWFLGTVGPSERPAWVWCSKVSSLSSWSATASGKRKSFSSSMGQLYHAVCWCLLAKNHSMKSCQVIIVAMKVSPNARPLDVQLCSTCFFHAVLVVIVLHQAKLRTDASSTQCNRHVFEPLPSVLCYTIFTYT